MPTRNPNGRVDHLMEEASAALNDGRYGDAERRASEALGAAFAAGMHALMARILLPLQEARRQRVAFAADAGPIRIVDHRISSEGLPDDGCWVIQPPLVGADARRLRNDAIVAGRRVAVLCREPLTRDGLCPIVAVGPTIVRTRFEAAEEGPERPPSHAWFAAALEALGDEAIATVNADLTPARRVIALFDRLETVVDHEKLHQALADACRDAANAPPEPARSAATTTRRSETATGPEDDIETADDAEP